MKRIYLSICASVVALSSFAGGLLTNTNQNATFLRNPARDAAIAIDGVYSNPAGTAFLQEGFHLSLSWQAAMQKRQITSNFAPYQLGGDDNGSKQFEGKATAPVIPSFQAAYVINNKWSVSAQFAVGGGGGKCEFAEGLPMFEKMVGYTLGSQMGQNLPYTLNQSLTGEQYFYGLQLGGTYKVIDKVSVFAGVRGVLANCSYTGAITNISIDGKKSADYATLSQQAAGVAQQYAEAAAQAQKAGMIEAAQQYAAAAEQYAAAATTAGKAAVMMSDYQLDYSQSGFGITPILGVDVNLGKLNLAAKYEFRTKINLENESNNSANVDALLPTYANDGKVRSDIPAILTVGAEYSVIPSVRVAAGFHYYWDKDAKGSAIKEGSNTWEAILGAEWDINSKWLVSAGVQRTQYGFADADISDLNYNINSTALCIGGAYKFNNRMKLNVGYMHSFYGEHNVAGAAAGMNDIYTRKNDAVGVSFDIRF